MIAVEKPRAKKPFLTTKPFGPWDIGNVEDIQHFVRILVALTLKANLVVAEAICKGDQELEEADTNLRSNWKSASKVQTIANILTESFNVSSNLYTTPTRRGKNYKATVKEETCQMAGFLNTTTNNHLPLHGQQVSSP